MLTDNEREWVIANKHLNLNGCIYVRHCRYTCYEPPYCPVIPTKENLIDAALFEAHVVAKLADPHYPPMDAGSDGPQLFMPPADRLKWAMIEVENEMDVENE